MKMKEKKNKFPAIIAVIIIVIVIIAVFKSMSVWEHKNSTVSSNKIIGKEISALVNQCMFFCN